MQSPETPRAHDPSLTCGWIWVKVEELLTRHERFLLTTHTSPDGDGLGSEIALKHYLELRGKRVQVVNPDPVPPNMAFLDPDGRIAVAGEGEESPSTPPADAIILVDASRWERLGPWGETLSGTGLPVLTIDHHPVHAEPVGVVRLLDPGACATGEIVYRLIERTGGPWSPEIALALYVAILTDTGSFRFTNTSPVTHRMAAHLLELGVEPLSAYHKVYEQKAHSQLQLLGEALSGMETLEDGEIVYMTVTQEMMRRHGLERADLEGIVSYTSHLAGSEIGVLFVELDQDEWHVSLRSRERADIGEVARSLGGGGHEHAAAARVPDSAEAVRKKVLARCREALRGHGGGGSGESNDEGR